MIEETPRSLRLYFAFIAVVSLFFASAAIYRGGSTSHASAGVNLTFGVLFAYIAMRFEKLLPKPTLIKVVLTISMVLSVISFAVSLRSGVQLSAIAAIVVSALIFVYLMKSVTRLSKEVRSQDA